MLELVHYIYAGPQSSFVQPEDTYKHSILLAMDNGSFQFEIGENSGSAAFGDLVFCPPGIQFKRQALSEITFHIFHFIMPFDDDHALFHFPANKVTVRDVARLSSTFTCLRNIHNNKVQAPHFSIMCRHLLSDLLLMCKFESTTADPRPKLADPLMQQALQHIQRHYLHDINMSEIATKLGIAQSQFTRRFQAAFGLTPVNYVTNLKLEKVKTMMLETEDSLESIAYECGFENGSYLSRVFRSKLGVNPSVFRRNSKI